VFAVQHGWAKLGRAELVAWSLEGLVKSQNKKVNSSSSSSIAMTIAISVWPFGLKGKAHGSRARAHDSLMGSCACGGVGLEYLPWISVRARLGVRKNMDFKHFITV